MSGLLGSLVAVLVLTLETAPPVTAELFWNRTRLKEIVRPPPTQNTAAPSLATQPLKITSSMVMSCWPLRYMPPPACTASIDVSVLQVKSGGLSGVLAYPGANSVGGCRGIDDLTTLHGHDALRAAHLHGATSQQPS